MKFSPVTDANGLQWVTQAEVNTLLNETVASIDASMKRLPFAKRTRETLLDGVRDGARVAIYATLDALNFNLKM